MSRARGGCCNHISSDGDWLVYRTEGAQQDIFVARTDGSAERKVTDNMAKEWAPRWSPDGSQIAFYSNLSGEYEVWTVSADGTRPTRLTELGDLTPLEPTWSSDGNQIIYYITDIGGFLIDPNVSFADQDPIQLPPVPLSSGASGAFRGRDWSGDDTKIVGVVDTEPGPDQSLNIVIYDVQAEEYELVTEGSLPFWMADQRRIIFRASAAAGFFVVDSVTKDIWSLDVAAVENVVLSPDNLQIYINRQETESDIWMIEMQVEERAVQNGGEQ